MPTYDRLIVVTEPTDPSGAGESVAVEYRMAEYAIPDPLAAPAALNAFMFREGGSLVAPWVTVRASVLGGPVRDFYRVGRDALDGVDELLWRLGGDAPAYLTGPGVTGTLNAAFWYEGGRVWAPLYQLNVAGVAFADGLYTVTLDTFAWQYTAPERAAVRGEFPQGWPGDRNAWADYVSQRPRFRLAMRLGGVGEAPTPLRLWARLQDAAAVDSTVSVDVGDAPQVTETRRYEMRWHPSLRPLLYFEDAMAGTGRWRVTSVEPTGRRRYVTVAVERVTGG